MIAVDHKGSRERGVFKSDTHGEVLTGAEPVVSLLFL